MSEEMTRTRHLAAIVGFSLAIAGSPAFGAAHSFDGIYSGKRVLTKGSVGPDCPAEDRVSITIHGQMLRFSNSILKKFTIIFDPNRDGSFGEIYADEGGDTVKIRGRVNGGVLDADVTNYGTNPPCEHHWHLKKNRSRRVALYLRFGFTAATDLRLTRG